MTRANRRKKALVQPGLPCMIVEVSTNRLMYYDKKEKILVYPEEAGKRPTIFPSGRKARTAKWHHVSKSGIPNSHTLWGIVPAVFES